MNAFMDETTNALFNLSKILPVKDSEIFHQDISAPFAQNISMREINKLCPKLLKINNSDPKGLFIESDFNKDGDSFRSPWSDTFFPPINSDKFLPKELRTLEEKLNILFKQYAKLYYGEKAVSSVYIIYSGDNISNGFECHVLIKNNITDSDNLGDNTFLDSISNISVKFVKEKDFRDGKKEKIKTIYKSNTIFSYYIKIKQFEDCYYNGTINISHLQQNYSQIYLDYDSHIQFIGTSVEENENNLRNQLDLIYLDKSNYICKSIRKTDTIGKDNNNKIKNLKSLCDEFEKALNDTQKDSTKS